VGSISPRESASYRLPPVLPPFFGFSKPEGIHNECRWNSMVFHTRGRGFESHRLHSPAEDAPARRPAQRALSGGRNSELLITRGRSSARQSANTFHHHLSLCLLKKLSSCVCSECRRNSIDEGCGFESRRPAPEMAVAQRVEHQTFLHHLVAAFHTPITDCGRSLPPQDAAIGDPQTPRLFEMSLKWKKAMEDFFLGQ
jgi:hypothetical protein